MCQKVRESPKSVSSCVPENDELDCRQWIFRQVRSGRRLLPRSSNTHREKGRGNTRNTGNTEARPETTHSISSNRDRNMIIITIVVMAAVAILITVILLNRYLQRKM